MKNILIAISLMVLLAPVCFGQGKGVDTQGARIKDGGTERSPANNGTKQDVGAGRGMDFGKGRTAVRPPLPNPYRLTARLDTIAGAVAEVMRDRKLILDESASKTSEGIFVSQPYTFIKGAVVAESELNRYANMPFQTQGGWTRGRYTIIVEVQPIDGISANVSVNAKIEGRSDGAIGAQWITLSSSGIAEEEFLTALVERVTGLPPPGYESASEP